MKIILEVDESKFSIDEAVKIARHMRELKEIGFNVKITTTMQPDDYWLTKDLSIESITKALVDMDFKKPISIDDYKGGVIQ